MQQPHLRKVVVALLPQWVACAIVVQRQERSMETSVQHVIALLNDMLSTTKAAKQAEAVQHAAYASWCTSTTESRTVSIDKSTEDIERLEAEIAKVEATTARLTREVLKHEQDIATWKLDLENATKMRENAAAHYEEERQAYSDAIDALQRARSTLTDQPGASLVQVAALQKMAVVPADAKRSLALALGQGMRRTTPLGDLAALDPFEVPEVAPYEVQSGGVIEILKGLSRKFEDELYALEAAEDTAVKSHDVFTHQNTLESEAAVGLVKLKTEEKAELAEQKQESEEKLAEERGDKKVDEEYLAEVTTTCKAKASAFANRESLRTEEITAMEEAIKVLESVTGTAETLEVGLLQAAGTNRTKSSFLALVRAALSGDGNNEQRAQKFLFEQGQKLNSQVLLTLASNIQDDDPFGKVKKLIQDLIFRLREEATEEAGHNGWCDAELATNKQTREDKAANVGTLQAKADALDVSILELTEAIEQLGEDVAELDLTMEEADALRTKERSANEKTIKDAQEVQQAIAKAMVILRQFFVSATAFIQKSEQTDAPEIFDSPYTVNDGGVLDVLEVVSAKFGSLEVDAERDEAKSAREFKALMHDSELDKVAKQKDIEYKTESKKKSEQQLVATKSDLKRTQAELDAAEDYLEKLKPSCTSGVSFDERKQRRDAEIQSLKDALEILGATAGESAADDGTR